MGEHRECDQRHTRRLVEQPCRYAADQPTGSVPRVEETEGQIAFSLWQYAGHHRLEQGILGCIPDTPEHHACEERRQIAVESKGRNERGPKDGDQQGWQWSSVVELPKNETGGHAASRRKREEDRYPLFGDNRRRGGFSWSYWLYMVAAITAGLGEFLGYSLRTVSGYIADRTGRYWLITFIGYAINLLAVPAIAFAGNWQVAALLILAERIGRAIRKPIVEAMLSYTTGKHGKGWVYAVSTTLDETGTTLGPLIMALALFVARGLPDRIRAAFNFERARDCRTDRRAHELSGPVSS